jgi:AraC-like DNA-binding protein
LNQIPSFAGAMLSAAPVPAPGRMRFTLDGAPERERPSLLREALGRQSTYDPEPLPDVPIEVDFEFQALQGLMMMSGKAHGLRTNRSRAALAADATDDIDLLVNLSGPLQVAHGAQELVLGDGEAVLVSMADVYSFVHRPPGGFMALRVPRGQFAPLVSGVDDLCYRRIPSGTPALSFLIDYVKAARVDQRIACPQLQRLFVAHVRDLIAVALGATRDAAELARGGGLRAARLQAIKDDIGKNLDRLDLSVATIADRHRCTPRFVQRLFEAEGTSFTEYVLEQRLARAHRTLTDLGREGEKISAVAWDCGFGDLSYFNRTFRRRYGVAPSEIRERARADAPATMKERSFVSVPRARRVVAL